MDQHVERGRLIGEVTPIPRPIHYLGSKLRVKEPIIDLVDQLDPCRQRVCDLFAGSGVVAGALAKTRPVTTVDIQEYSRVLCTALLRPAEISASTAEELLSKARRSQLHADLSWAAAALLDYESRAAEEASERNHENICQLIERGSIVSFEKGATTIASPNIARPLKRLSHRLKQLGLERGPKAVALRHFGGVYFSYRQSIDLASLLDVVHSLGEPLKSTALAAVLSTASDTVNTVGKQFAQPIKPRDAKGNFKVHLIRKILQDRSLDVFSTFERWLERYSLIGQPSVEHRVFCADYSVALARHCSDVKIIYADPPYTRDHYSRFYHALETMCLWDDPEIAATHPSSKSVVGRGVYRLDRHQSPFCIKSQAPDAFGRLFRGVKNLGVPLLLSYSPLAQTTKPRPRVVETTDLVALARGFFRNVELLSAGRISHNKLNSAYWNSEISHEAESFLVCS